MFNRDTILQNLNAENYYIDKHSLDLFLNDWKIDSIYEDEDGLEFYDDLSLDKIKKGISLKSQGYSDEQIISKLQKMEAIPPKTSEPVEPILVKDYLEPAISEENNKNETDFTEEENIVTDLTPTIDKKFTLDVSSQTLQMLAEAVAKKISDDITNSDLSKKLIEAGGYKRDNEIMAKQIQELLEHNKELSDRITQLESNPSRSIWKRIWGQK
ncbi:hypothetical protein IJO12_04255 [bacterium]|nr:hypothetical protein [bacterium]